MHIVEAAAPAAIPTLAPGRRLVRKMDGESNGVLWAVFEDLDLFQFGFTTSVGFDSGATFANATRAGKEAVAWCAAYVAEPVFAPAPVLEVVGAADFDAAVYGEPEPAVEWDHDTGPLNAVDEPAAPPARNPIGEHMIDGWRIVVGDDRGGAYQAQTFRPDGSAGDAFTGYEYPGVALSDAAVWCSGHAVDDLVADDLPIRTLSDAVDAEVCGWRVIVGDDRSDDGSFMVECVDAETGVTVGGAGDFAGFSGTAEACEYGCKYARENPTPSFAAVSAEAAGWRIFAAKLRGGKFEPVLIDAATGEEADLDGAQQPADTREEAIELGTTWAISNPTQAAVDKTERIWSRVDDARRPALEADMSRAADRLDRDTAELEAELARVTRERDEARAAHARDTKACNAVAVDLAWQTERKATLEARIADDKDELKGVVKRLKELETEVKQTLEAVGKGKQVPLFPTLTIPGAPVAVTFRAGDRPALQQAAQRFKTERAVDSKTWTHGGIDYAIEARENADGWRSWVHGYEATTEGVGPEREDAERETKDRAVAVLPNAGGLRPPPRVEAPATDKPKRGRKPKAGAK